MASSESAVVGGPRPCAPRVDIPRRKRESIRKCSESLHRASASSGRRRTTGSLPGAVAALPSAGSLPADAAAGGGSTMFWGSEDASTAAEESVRYKSSSGSGDYSWASEAEVVQQVAPASITVDTRQGGKEAMGNAGSGSPSHSECSTPKAGPQGGAGASCLRRILGRIQRLV